MSDDGPERCGEPNKTGGACKNPVSNPDGSCHIPSHGPGDGDDPGRPTKLTPQLQEAIAADLEQGYSLRVATETNGIAYNTYRVWMKRGKAAKESNKEGPFVDFRDRMVRARRQGERKWTERAYKYAVEADSFGAVMEILRKRYPESWTGGQDEKEEERRLRVMLRNEDRGDTDKPDTYAMTPDDADTGKD
jgi:hypothetical protein